MSVAAKRRGRTTPPRLLAKSRRSRPATTRSRQQACCRGSQTGGDNHPPFSAEEHVAQPCADERAQRTVRQEKARRPAMAGPSEEESRGEKPFLGVVPENSEKNTRMQMEMRSEVKEDGTVAFASARCLLAGGRLYRHRLLQIQIQWVTFFEF